MKRKVDGDDEAQHLSTYWVPGSMPAHDTNDMIITTPGEVVITITSQRKLRPTAE